MILRWINNVSRMDISGGGNLFNWILSLFMLVYRNDAFQRCKIMEIVDGYCDLECMQNEPKPVVEIEVGGLDGTVEIVKYCESCIDKMKLLFVNSIIDLDY